MVNHVKHGQVSELLPQQEEQRVEVVNELREEIPPGHVQCKHSIIGIYKNHSILMMNHETIGEPE